ncbi:PepSY domain-containing protein [Streptomyces sp. NPDC002669]|uniref:PepSY domain-containing protein n=1 Tax=Streptomyces sp. NPDC002669 TaxID=3364658 RepID=UPI0036789728
MKSLEHAPAGSRRMVAAVLAATAALGGATTTATASSADGPRTVRTAVTAPSPGNDHDEDAALAKSAEVDIKRAAETAEKSVAGTVTAADLDGSPDKPVWKVDVTDSHGTEHEVTVNATDGKVTATRTDKDQSPEDRSADAALAKSARTDLAKAVDAALAEVDGTATSAGLENDHGTTPAWRIDVTNLKDRNKDHEVTVDATTGKVTATRTDEDSGRNADDRAGAGRLLV